ncbi:hypothetical protein QVD17_38343 [Tagetes erecta]|uniref:SWIM-type domain-containing protein n=1 Tax=Tagetes erecta TaxID=13708 RepID=A0AAD8JRY4_TARER|nr:hypothetical protein QVD17_38343 [Tagetes erecta]
MNLEDDDVIMNLEDEDVFVNLEEEDVTVNLEDEDVTMKDAFLNLLCFDNDDEDEIERNSVEDWSESEKDYEKDVEDDEDYEDEGVVYPCYNPSIDWKLVKPIVTMKFESPSQLKDMLIDYGVANGYQLVFTVNDNNRLLVRCGIEETNVDETGKKTKVWKCPFRLWASRVPDDDSFQIKTLNDQHACSRQFYLGSLLTYSWIAKRFFKEIIRNPEIPLRQLQQDVMRKYQCRCRKNQKAIKTKHYDVIGGGNNIFEVRSEKNAYAVNIQEQSCTCGSWQLSGIPCRHTVAALVFINKEPDAYVSNWFKKDKFKDAYKHGITPLKGSIHWPKTDDIKPLPPKEKRMPGRPKVKRNRDPSEKEKKNNKVKSGRKMTCQNCQESGHNKRSCNNEKRDPQPKEVKQKGRKKKVDSNM